nr:hypothetical protein [Tanacetum cinerariifolium]
MSKDLSILRRNKVNWHYVRDDNIFSTIKVVSRHQNTQQYGAILPIELTNEDIRNTTAYKEYYACATGVAAPKPKASARNKMGDSDTSLTPHIATPKPLTTVSPVPRKTAAAKGKQPAKAKKQETHISHHGGSSTDEGTDVDAQDEGDKNDEIDDESDDGSDDGNDDDNDETVKDGSKRDEDDDDNDEEEEIAKIDESDDTKSDGGNEEVTESDREDEEEETRQEEEESFDPIPRTPEDDEDDGNGDDDQGLRMIEEERIQEEEEADELYRVESIFMTASSPIVSLQTPTPIMTPSTIATITTSTDAPNPPTPIL